MKKTRFAQVFYDTKKKQRLQKKNSSDPNLSKCKQYHILTYLFNCYQAILQQKRLKHILISSHTLLRGFI